MTHTLADIHALSNDQLRKAIAVELGFEAKEHDLENSDEKYYQLLLNGKPYITEGENRGLAFDEDICFWFTPNYPESIKDAYALEESVPINKRGAYMDALSDVIHPAGWRSIQDIDSGERNGWPGSFYMIHATARQKSEAWLLWKEGKR